MHGLAVRKNDVIAKNIPTLLQLAASAVTSVGVALPHPKVSVDQLFGGSRGRTRAQTSEIRSKRPVVGDGGPLRVPRNQRRNGS